MASDMMGKMKPEEIQNMMRTFQQNPEMMEQARRMMGGQMPPGANFGQPTPPPAQSGQHHAYSTPSSLAPIIDIKNQGNEFIKKKDYEKAGLKYLESILDIETLRTRLTAAQTSDSQFLSALNDLEISCRNNYCIAKSYLGEFNLLLPHCERVLLMDPKNQKALFNASQAYYNLRELENARNTIEKLISQLGVGPFDDKITDLKGKIDAALAKKEEEAAMPKEPKSPEKVGASQEHDDPELRAEPKSPSPMFTKEVKVELQKTELHPKQPEPKERVVSSKKDDFEIEYENESAQLEALFKRRQNEDQQRHSAGTTAEPEAKPQTESSKSEPATATPFTTPQQPPAAPTVAPHTSFINRYWQVLLGILIGLLLSRLLKN